MRSAALSESALPGPESRPRYNFPMAVTVGERRIVTVLFADIVGSTAIGERLGARALEAARRRGDARS